MQTTSTMTADLQREGENRQKALWQFQSKLFQTKNVKF